MDACCGVTPIADWRPYGANQYVDVNMQKCGFYTTPQIFSTMRGASSHWTATGSNSHYQTSATGFRVYVTAPFAWRYRFNYQISWCAFGQKRPDAARKARRSPKLSTCCGQTTSKWNRYNAEGHLWKDIDTRRCGFTATPQVFTALNGLSSHWVLRGVTATYFNTPNGFRTYIYGATPEFASTYKYRLSWCAVGPTQKRYRHGVHVFNRFEQRVARRGRICCGKVPKPQWNDYSSAGIVTTVDTSACHFSNKVRYFGSLNGDSGNWLTTGGEAIYSPSPKSFVTYIYAHGWGLRAVHARAYNFSYDWCGVDHA